MQNWNDVRRLPKVRRAINAAYAPIFRRNTILLIITAILSVLFVSNMWAEIFPIFLVQYPLMHDAFVAESNWLYKHFPPGTEWELDEWV